MKLQDQCCTIEQGQRLVELGVKAESYFSHLELPETKYRIGSDEIVSTGTLNHFTDKGRVVPAFNVAELGVLLLSNIPWSTQVRRFDNGQLFCIVEFDRKLFSNPSTEAQGRAGLLIYLLENELISL